LSGVAVLGAAFVHCSADGTATHDDLDAGMPPLNDDGSSPIDGGAGSPDVQSDVDIADAGNCSADHWCRTLLPEPAPSLTAVWSFAADDAIAASTEKMFHWDGATWSAVDAPAAEGLTSLWASSPTDVWGVSQYSRRLAHGTRAGAGRPFTWTKVEFDAETTPTMDIVRGAGNELWVYGQLNGEHVLSRGTVTFESGADGGSTPTVSWTTLPIAFPELTTVSSFWVTADGKVWLAGLASAGWLQAGAVIVGVPRADDPGRHDWEKALQDTPGDYVGLTAIWGASTELWAIGNVGHNFRGGLGADGGVAFRPVASNAKTTMRSIWGSGPNDVWIVGEAGGIRHWDGTEWSVSRVAIGGIPLWQNLTAVHGRPDGDVWAVGDGVALHRVTGGAP